MWKPFSLCPFVYLHGDEVFSFMLEAPEDKQNDTHTNTLFLEYGEEWG